MAYSSELMSLSMRLRLARYGSYDGIREASVYDPVSGCYVLPENHPDDVIVIHQWGIANYDKLWKHEKTDWYDDYMACRCNVKPNWIEKLIHRIKTRA